MGKTIQVEGIGEVDQAAALAALFNRSQQLGMGALDLRGRDSLTVERAQEILDGGSRYFDYLYGRVMKIDMESLDFRLYDRDNGVNAGFNAILAIQKGVTNA